MNFLHYFQPQPVIWELGIVSIRWYGFLIALALAVCLAVVTALAKKNNIKSDDVFDLGLWLVIGGIIGARLYEVLIINWQYYAAHSAEIIKVWHGGLAIHGAIIGGLLALYFWIRKNKKDFWPLADLIAVVLPLGQAIGRWGNYFNGELYGRPTDSALGIPIAPFNRLPGWESYNYFQPVFLYESVLNFILFLVLFFLYRHGGKSSAGKITAAYLLGYAVIRFFMEFVRLDPTPEFGGLRLPQWASLIIFSVAVAILAKRKKANDFLFDY